MIYIPDFCFLCVCVSWIEELSIQDRSFCLRCYVTLSVRYSPKRVIKPLVTPSTHLSLMSFCRINFIVIL